MKEMIAEYEEENEVKVIDGEPTCPTCGEVIDEEDCYDHIYGGSYMERLCVGTCPSCGNTYQYCEVFFYGGHSKVEKSED
jgi:hypothetical protein